MEMIQKWQKLGWRHPLWDVIRYYRSLRGGNNQKIFLNQLTKSNSLAVDNKILPIPADVSKLMFSYLDDIANIYQSIEADLRTEEEALAYCKTLNYKVDTTKTKNKDHHQSSKVMIASVTEIAERVCKDNGLTLDPDPQNRCVWLRHDKLHVTSRNLDGAIPGLANPSVVWETKEYWGKTKGGSKMSDAVYECQLVGRELREYEETTKSPVVHIVFMDGKEQWSHRKSDLRRFIDLSCQGLIDYLIVGRQVESTWEPILRNIFQVGPS